MALEKLKTITHSVPETFDREFNAFVSNPDNNVVKVDLQTTSQAKRTVHTAYIFYVAKEDWNKYIEVAKRLQQPAEMPKLPSKTKRGRPKKNGNNVEVKQLPTKTKAEVVEAKKQ